jgi:hypothetical protein
MTRASDPAAWGDRPVDSDAWRFVTYNGTGYTWFVITGFKHKGLEKFL